MSDNRTHTVIVTLPEGSPLDWSRIGQILAWHGRLAFVPHIVVPVRRSTLAAAARRTTRPHLLDVARHHGVTLTAGGRLSCLDLHGLATDARTAATRRWCTWHALVATSTPKARPWEHFLGEHLADPDRLTRAEARRRFEAQPRVLAMLAYNTYPAAAHHLDPLELVEYQAGEAVYVALHWQHVLTGDGLIDLHGRLLEAGSPALGDRLRYVAEASRAVHALTRRDHLVVVRAATA